MHRKPKQAQKEKIQVQIDLRPQIRTLLQCEYLTKFPQKVKTFEQLVQIATRGLQESIFRLKSGLTTVHIQHYGIKDYVVRQCPYPEQQVQLLSSICQLCQTILHNRDYNITTESLKQLNTLLHHQCNHTSLRDQNQEEIYKIEAIQYAKIQQMEERKFHQKELEVFEKQEDQIQYDKSRMKLHLVEKFNQFTLNFRYINVKEAMVYETLRRCQIWFTICRERKKSAKGFYLDPLINTFDSIIKKTQCTTTPFHISVLPRKNVRKIELKKNVQKSKNLLFQAVANRKYAEVKKLILNGAEIEAPGFSDQRMTREMRCAHKAAANNDLQMCKILTSFDVNWQSLDSQLMTPLYYAIQAKSTQVMKYLIQQIKVNIEHEQIQDRTPFYWACTQGQIEYIRYLYDRGADINRKSRLGRCPLSKACFLGRKDIVEFLLQCKEIDMLSKDGKGRTALHNATFGPKGGREGQKFGTNGCDSPECAQLLLQKGFPIDQTDFEKNTSLHIAASSQALDSIPLLMAFGASLNAHNDYGQTPILTAAKFGHLQTVKLLYEKYHSSILGKDIFGKNIMMLVAKFRQFKENTHKHFPADGTIAEKTQFRKQNTQVNPVFEYIVDKFIYEAYCKYLKQQYSSLKYKQEKLSYLSQLHLTFFQLMKHGIHQQFMLFTQRLIEWKVPFPELKLKDVKSLLQMEMSFQGQREKRVAMYILHSKNSQGYHVFQLQKQGIIQFITWLLRKNSNTMLQFVADNQVLVFYHFCDLKKQEHETHYQLPMNILSGSIPFLKEKIITFCLLNLNFNWIQYVDEVTGGNILHLLVKSRKVGSLIQVTKLLGGKKLNFVKNKFVQRLLTLQHQAEQQHKADFHFNLSPINQLFMQLLSHKDNDDLTPYQLAHVVKETSIIKILSERMKQQSLQWGNGILQKLQVKEYKIDREMENQQELRLFQMGHQKQQELEEFIKQIQQCTTKQQLAKHLKILTSDTKELGEKVNIEHDIHLQWNNFKHRPLHYIKTENDINLLKPLLNGPKVVGIDVEYDFADGNETIICIIQLSSLEEDYIIDMMACTFQNLQNSYVNFVYKLKHQFFKPLCYDRTITKLMHGSDHDLYILKSCFNCSFVNFLDSSRIDVDLRKIRDGKKITAMGEEGNQGTPKKENKSIQLAETKLSKGRCVRGLATLVKQYLGIAMSKDHQISQWKIRPIPTTMIEYARRDSMIMPFLMHKQLTMFQNINDLKNSIINGFRIAKKNKKPLQPLIKNLIAM